MCKKKMVNYLENCYGLYNYLVHDIFHKIFKKINKN